MDMIKEGSEAGYLAKVDSDNKLETHSITAVTATNFNKSIVVGCEVK